MAFALRLSQQLLDALLKSMQDHSWSVGIQKYSTTFLLLRGGAESGRSPPKAGRSSNTLLCDCSTAAAAPHSGGPCQPQLPLCAADTRGPGPQPGPCSSPPPPSTPRPPLQPGNTVSPSAGSGTASASAEERERDRGGIVGQETVDGSFVCRCNTTPGSQLKNKSQWLIWRKEPLELTALTGLTIRTGLLLGLQRPLTSSLAPFPKRPPLPTLLLLMENDL
ncbi:hypothetical protein INR49_028109 [Caranx melampygus]|nr:hypothetical protein INR49_028109 [Caranx melampygus]